MNSLKQGQLSQFLRSKTAVDAEASSRRILGEIDNIPKDLVPINKRTKLSIPTCSSSDLSEKSEEKIFVFSDLDLSISPKLPQSKLQTPSHLLQSQESIVLVDIAQKDLNFIKIEKDQLDSLGSDSDSSSSNEKDENAIEITGSEGEKIVDSLAPTSELHDNPATETTAKDKKKTRNRGKRKNLYNKNPNKLTGKQKFIAEYLDSKSVLYKNDFESWLRYNERLDSLICELCQLANMTTHNLWGDKDKGFKLFSKKECYRHLAATSHVKAIKLLEQARKSLPLSTILQANKAETKIEEEIKFTEDVATISKTPIDYQNLIKNIYWGCKEEIAILKIKSLHHHTKESLNVSIPNYHLSIKGFSPIIESIGRCICREYIKDIQTRNHIGIMIDESTDSSNKEILLLYIRFFSKSKKKIQEVFIHLFELEAKTSESIYKTIKPFLIDNKLFEKIKFYCSDAAANVSSEKNGVPGLMQKDLKVLKSFKCLAHAENTALRHTYTEFKQMQTFNKGLTHLISYMDGSPKRIRILENAQLALDYENTYQVLKAIVIRWNSFCYATDRLRILYPALHEALDEFIRIAVTAVDTKEAKEIKEKYLLDFNFVYTMHWLCDFLPPLADLNKSLQASTYQLAKLKDDIETVSRILLADYIEFKKPPIFNESNYDLEKTDDEIMQYHLRFGSFHLSLFLSRCQFIDKTTVRYNYVDEKFTILKYSKLEAIELKFLVNNAATYLNNEILALIPEEKSFFHNFQIFDFSDIRTFSVSQLDQYGNKEIDALAQIYLKEDPKYQQELEYVIFQWKKMKNKLFSELKKPEKELNEYLRQKQFIIYILTNDYFTSGYEGLLQLVEVYACLPCTNAEVERGFSAMNRIKTDIRNRLLPEKLNDLMMISLNGGKSGQWSSERIDEWFNFWKINYDIRNI